MNSATDETLKLTSAERDILAELLQSERFKLKIEIRNVSELAFRIGLCHRLSVVESLIERFEPPPSTGTALREASIR